MSSLHEIRPLRMEDWEAVRQIYAEGISTGLATLETRAPGWEEWDLAHAPVPRLVALHGGEVAGWAALSIYALFLPASASATDEARVSSPANAVAPATDPATPKASNTARGNS